MNITDTPWGMVQHQHELAPGIVEVSTASHGGIYVADELLDRIPAAWREWSAPWSGSANWFEEDCAACGVIIAFPQLFSAEANVGALRTAEHYGLPAAPLPASPAPKIWSGSWGYEQTNVEFYQVLKVAGDWITLQKIDQIETSDGALSMTGRVIPAEPHAAIGEPFRRKIFTSCGEPCAKIRSYEYARPWDGKPERVSHYG